MFWKILKIRNMSSKSIKVNPKDGGIKNEVYYDVSKLTDVEKFQYINSVYMIYLELANALKRK